MSPWKLLEFLYMVRNIVLATGSVATLLTLMEVGLTGRFTSAQAGNVGGMVAEMATIVMAVVWYETHIFRGPK